MLVLGIETSCDETGVALYDTGTGLLGLLMLVLWFLTDFRGVPERTVKGSSGTLADSNERAGGGFAPTFVTELIWGVFA